MTIVDALESMLRVAIGEPVPMRDRVYEPIAPGLVRCATCGTDQAPRFEGGQLGVHFATLADQRPCVGSWPAKAVR